MNKLYLDIETIRADNYLDFMPEELKNPPEFKAEMFNPDKVKRLKKDTDETYKIKVDQAKIAHDDKQTDKGIEQLSAYLEKREAWIKKCALSPLTGQVACVGASFNAGEVFVWRQYVETITVTEEDIITRTIQDLRNADLIIGHNIKEFDLWFLYNRCRKYGIEFPNKLYKKYNGRFYWSENIIDTMDLWGCGKYKEMVSLNSLAIFFGLEPKDNDVSKNFEEIWNTDRERAIEHCRKDVLLTKQIYDKLK